MEAPELDIAPLLEPLKPPLWKAKVHMQDSEKADVCLCEEALGIRLEELTVERNTAFVPVSDSSVQSFVKARGDGKALAFH